MDFTHATRRQWVLVVRAALTRNAYILFILLVTHFLTRIPDHYKRGPLNQGKS